MNIADQVSSRRLFWRLMFGEAARPLRFQKPNADHRANRRALR